MTKTLKKKTKKKSYVAEKCPYCGGCGKKDQGDTYHTFCFMPVKCSWCKGTGKVIRNLR